MMHDDTLAIWEHGTVGMALLAHFSFIILFVLNNNTSVSCDLQRVKESRDMVEIHNVTKPKGFPHFSVGF